MSPDEQTSAPKTCPVEMADLEPCGRPIHPTLRDVDEEPVCMMHSRDPNKDKQLFRQEIDAILNDTSRHHRPTGRFDFREFVFPEADFGGTTFTRVAVFMGTTFTQDADFSDAKFARYAHFSWAKFTQDAYFSGVTFAKEADINEARFTKNAYFRDTIFARNADFGDVVFTQDVSFIEAGFTKGADFRGATFTKGADFSEATFTETADFQRTHFERPTQIHFFQVNKDTSEGFRARFLNCRVEELHFEDVNWYKQGPRMMLQDELDVLTGESKAHELVAVAYRQLINNFERTRAYHLAEDCSIGAMEMRRRNAEHFAWPFRKLYERHRWARKLGEQFSVVNAYRFLSNYGSSYTRALAVMIILVFVVFGPAFALPWAGLEPAATQEIMSPEASGWLQAAEDFQAGMLHSLEVATFQRNRLHIPTSYFGRLVSALETVVIPAQLALLLLALRRRFRR